MKHEVLAIRHVYFEDLGNLELVLGDRGHFGALSRCRPWPHRRPESARSVADGRARRPDRRLRRSQLSASHAVALDARKAHRGRAADHRHLPRRAVDRALARCARLSGGATGTRLGAARAHRCRPGFGASASRSRRPVDARLSLAWRYLRSPRRRHASGVDARLREPGVHVGRACARARNVIPKCSPTVSKAGCRVSRRHRRKAARARPRLRADTARFGPGLERAARAMFGEWLDQFDFRQR